MENAPSMADFDKAIRELGRALFDWIKTKSGPIAWAQATLDVRYASDGSYWNHKIRMLTPEHGAISFGTNLPIDQALSTLNDLRPLLGWYSFKMQIENTGNVGSTSRIAPRIAADIDAGSCVVSARRVVRRVPPATAGTGASVRTKPRRRQCRTSAIRFRPIIRWRAGQPRRVKPRRALLGTASA